MNRRVISEISRVKELMGVINENIESVLTGGKILRKGSGGSDVEKLQQILIKMGYDLGEFGPNKDGVDGKFGNTMDRAVRDFQGKNDLKVDGKVGKNTLSKMISVGQEKVSNFSSFLDTIGISMDSINSLLSATLGVGGKLFGGEEPDESKDHFVFYFVFPKYQPKFDKANSNWFEEGVKKARSKFESYTGWDLEEWLGWKKGTYGWLGHAGVALINSSGNVSIFEFGRYGGA